jgi:hypothetical protein
MVNREEDVEVAFVGGNEECMIKPKLTKKELL